MQIDSIDDIFNDDEFGLLDVKDDGDIFTLKHISKSKQSPEFISHRKPMNDKEFKGYKDRFSELHKSLEEKIFKLEKFNTPSITLQKNKFYVLNGLLIYLESVDENSRVKLIVENQTKSNMLYTSLERSLYKDGYLIIKK